MVDATFMHHKFCIIDQAVLLTGTANYTYNGFHKNNESIFLIDQSDIISEFLSEFERLAAQFTAEDGIIVSPIKQFLQSQINVQNSQISWLASAIAETEKTIELYEASYRVRFQAIIGEILWLQKNLLAYQATITEKTESKQKHQEAQQRWESFQSAISEDKKIIEKGSDAALQENLKQLYREGAILCHPDSPLVKEEFKAKTQQVFLKLKAAYERNSLEELQDLLSELRLGIAFGNSDFATVSLEELEEFVQKLTKKAQQLVKRLSTLQLDPRFLLQTGDETSLQHHLAKEEMQLTEKRRILREEAQRAGLRLSDS